MDCVFSEVTLFEYRYISTIFFADNVGIVLK